MMATVARACLALCLLALAPAAAQPIFAPSQKAEDPDEPLPTTNRIGRVADSAVGQAGQRQAPGQGTVNIKPTARIDNRIQSRVQSRIRSRIDRSYDPQAQAKNPFAAAEEAARRPRR